MLSQNFFNFLMKGSLSMISQCQIFLMLRQIWLTQYEIQISAATSSIRASTSDNSWADSSYRGGRALLACDSCPHSPRSAPPLHFESSSWSQNPVPSCTFAKDPNTLLLNSTRRLQMGSYCKSGILGAGIAKRHGVEWIAQSACTHFLMAPYLSF